MTCGKGTNFSVSNLDCQCFFQNTGEERGRKEGKRRKRRKGKERKENRKEEPLH